MISALAIVWLDMSPNARIYMGIIIVFTSPFCQIGWIQLIASMLLVV
jgi:hypothetical protein